MNDTLSQTVEQPSGQNQFIKVLSSVGMTIWRFLQQCFVMLAALIWSAFITAVQWIAALIVSILWKIMVFLIGFWIIMGIIKVCWMIWGPKNSF